MRFLATRERNERKREGTLRVRSKGWKKCEKSFSRDAVCPIRSDNVLTNDLERTGSITQKVNGLCAKRTS